MLHATHAASATDVGNPFQAHGSSASASASALEAGTRAAEEGGSGSGAGRLKASDSSGSIRSRSLREWAASAQAFVPSISADVLVAALVRKHGELANVVAEEAVGDVSDGVGGDAAGAVGAGAGAGAARDPVASGSGRPISLSRAFGGHMGRANREPGDGSYGIGDEGVASPGGKLQLPPLET